MTRSSHKLDGLPNDLLTSDIENERRLKVDSDAVTSAFGELMTAQETPITQISAEYGLLGVVVANLGGTTSVSDGMFVCSTGAGTNNVSAILSARECNQRPGQGLVTKFSALFTDGVPNNTQESGLISSESVFAFGYNGVDFGVLYASAGQLEIQSLQITVGATTNQNATITVDGVSHIVAITNSTINQNAYEIAVALNLIEPRYRFSSNEDKVIALARLPDFGDGLFSFSSGTALAVWTEVLSSVIPTEVWVKKSDWNVAPDFNVTPSNLNDYKIQIQGNINFFIKDEEDGKFKLVHIIKYIDNAIKPSIANPTFRIGWATRNTGNTSDIIVKGAYTSAFIEGALKYNQTPLGKDSLQLSVGSVATNVISFRNRSVFKGRPNRAEIIPILLSLGTDSIKSVIFEIISRPTTTEFMSWEYIDIDNSIMEYSTSNVPVSGNDVAVFVVSSNGKDVDMQKLLEFQIPTSDFSITARTTSGSASTMIASGTWKEDL